MLQRMPGRRVRADIRGSLVPSLRSCIHALMRACYGLPFFFTGHPQLALVFLMMAGMILFSNVESRITVAFADGINRLRETWWPGSTVKEKEIADEHITS